MVILGLDVGDKRIGMAIADDMGVRPHSTLGHNRQFLNELVKLWHELHFDAIVVGWPLTFTGQAGHQAGKVGLLVDKIKAKLPVEIIFEDERFTTKEAAARLRLSPSPRFDIDAVSALLILEGYLKRKGQNG